MKTTCQCCGAQHEFITCTACGWQNDDRAPGTSQWDTAFAGCENARSLGDHRAAYLRGEIEFSPPKPETVKRVKALLAEGGDRKAAEGPPDVVADAAAKFLGEAEAVKRDEDLFEVLAKVQHEVRAAGAVALYDGVIREDAVWLWHATTANVALKARIEDIFGEDDEDPFDPDTFEGRGRLQQRLDDEASYREDFEAPLDEVGLKYVDESTFTDEQWELVQQCHEKALRGGA